MDDKFWELATKYVANEASDEDMRILFELMEENTEYAKAFDKLAKNWKDLDNYPITHLDVNKAKAKMLSKLTQSEKETKISAKSPSRILLRIAAALVIVTGFYSATRLVLNQYQWKEFTTAQNEKLKIVLPDNSVIWLNENSVLAYNFSKENQRKLKLKGEAFFDVTRDTTRPFTIKSEYFDTQVLGTSFNIKSDISREHTVSVISGKVEVTNSNKPETVLLTKGQQAYYNVNLETIDRKILNGFINEKAWIDRNFVFENIKVQDALKYLSKAYKVEFEFEPATIGDCLFTAKFNNDNLLTIMNMMCASLDLKYQFNKNERKIIISGRGCKKNRG